MADAEAGPPEREATNLRFQQLTRLKVFDEKPETLTPVERYQLLAVSNRYGYTFMGCDIGLKILKTADICKIHDQHQDDHQDNPNAVVDEYPCLKVALASQPVHLALSADDLILSMCSMTDGGLSVELFDIRTLVHKSINASPFAKATLSKEADAQLVSLLWNPGIPTYFATCLSDGSMALWDCSGDGIKRVAQLPNEVEPTAMCWSPKGKQIVVGTSSGKLVQYNQKLEQKKAIPPPDFSVEPTKVVDILWLSTYFFAVAYIDAEETLQPNLTIVNAPKEGMTTFLNFEDVCYGSTEMRTAQYQLLNVDKWGFLIAASNNSTEAAVVGRSPDNKALWEIWTLDDAARIEMPLSEDDGDDTFPMGIALDLTSQSAVKIGNKIYHPPPIVMVLSTEGLLCPYYVLNSDATEAITTLAQPLSPEGERVATGKAEPSQPPVSVATPQDAAKPVAVFTAALPIHKSSSTGSFTLSSSSSSSGVGSTATGQSDRSASFTFSLPKSTAPSSGGPTVPSFGASPSLASSLAKPQPSVTTASSSPGMFVFGSKLGDSKGASGGASKLDSFSFVAPKAIPASTSLAPSTPPPGAPPFRFKVPGADDNDGTSVQGKPIQQPVSDKAAAAAAAAAAGPQDATAQGWQLPQPIPQAKPSTPPAQTPPAASAPQPPGSLSADHLKTQYPASASSSAFALSQQKTAADAASVFSGGGLQQQTQGIKASSSSPSMRIVGSGQQPVPPSLSGQAPSNQALPLPQAATPSSGAIPKNQVVSSRTGFAPNQVAPSFAPNQVAPRSSDFPVQVAASDAASRPPPPAYSAGQPPRQALPEPKPTPSAEAAAAEKGSRPRGKGSFTATPVEAAYLSNISAEMDHFSKELAELQSHARRAHFKVGEPAELETIKKSTDGLVKFKAEVLDVTKSHNEEIHELRSKLLAAFAQLEDARVLRQRNHDPRYLQLLRLRGLDPKTAQQRRSIQGNCHYLETGLADVNGCLDAQWEEFHQRKSRREGRKLGTPTMDTIYQTLSHHYNILISQRGKLQELRQQLIQARRYDITEAPWQRGMLSPPDRSGDLSSLATKLSITSITSPTKARATPVSTKKQAQLRKALSRRATTPRRTASKVDLSDINSPALSQGSDDYLFPTLTSRQLHYQDEEPIQPPPPASRWPADSLDVPDVRAGSGISQARSAGVRAGLLALPSQRVEAVRDQSSGVIERRQTPAALTPVPPSSHTEPVPTATQAPAVTTNSPSSFTHSGRGTVVWGTQTTPTKAPPSTRAPTLGTVQRKGVEKAPELPPVVNIKNLDVTQSTVLPPVTFAQVNSTVDAGTAKVVNQVLAEMAKTSGYPLPEASGQSAERKISFSDEPPPIVQPMPPSKLVVSKTAASGTTSFGFGASKPPAVQPPAANMSAIPPAATTSGMTGFGLSASKPPIVQSPAGNTSGISPSANTSGTTGFSLSASKPPAVQPLPTNTSAIPPSATTTPGATFSTSASSSVPMFGSASSVFGVRNDSSSSAVTNASTQGLPMGKGFSFSAGSVVTKADTPTTVESTTPTSIPSGLSSNTITSKPAFGAAAFASSGFPVTAPQQSSLPTPSIGDGSSATSVPGVKPSLFDFKDQRSAASASTPGGFFVAGAKPVKEPSQDQFPQGATATAVETPSTSTEVKATPKPVFGVKPIVTTPPTSSAIQPTATVAPTASVSSGVGVSFGLATAKPSTGVGLKPAAGNDQSLGVSFGQATVKPSTGVGLKPAAGSDKSLGVSFGQATVKPSTGAGLQPAAGSDQNLGVSFGQATVKPSTGAGLKPAAGSDQNLGVSFGQATVKPPTGVGLKPAASSDQSGLKQLLAGEDEAGTGLPSPPTVGPPSFGAPAISQPVGEDEAGSGVKPSSALGIPDMVDNRSASAAQPTTTAATTATTTTAAGLFGVPAASPADSSGSTAGGSIEAKTTAAGFFGTATTSTAAASSGPATGFSFGATPSPGVFGAPKFGATTTASGFGSAAPAPTTTTNAADTVKSKMPTTLFGLLKDDPPVPSSSSSGPVFGATTTAATTVSKNLFGQPASTGSSLFGQSAPSGGMFGQPTSSAPSSVGLFGSVAATSSGGGLFGQPASTSSSRGLFGQAAASTSSSGLFGQSSSAGSSLFQQGSSGGPFGSSSSGSAFGQQSGGMFGRPSSGVPTFGQGASVFGQPATTAPSSSSMFGGAGGDGGGGFFSGLGHQPSPEAARTNPFGSPIVSSSSGFGSSASGGSSIFGGQGATSFGSGGGTAAASNTGSVFGGGFSSPGAGVAKAGFGGFNQQSSASAGGFGSAPSFGSPPAFGSAPTFGGTAFGSPGTGAPSPFGQTPAFGASTSTSQASGGFSGFATQETPTFGSLSSAGSRPPQSSFGGFGSGGTQSGGFGGFGSGSSSNNTTSGGFGSSSSFTQYR